ncbi:MAG: YbhB/YbcL family Raf kinase inhibitor-like protein, partial [Candidatus Nitrosotalea sp.]|nr:YbhB/YbcL family Raf kinase inhibitor-like protein [Candidatus Nitrosotalea sp.]
PQSHSYLNCTDCNSTSDTQRIIAAPNDLKPMPDNIQQILKVSSSAFRNEGNIPSEFTCDGQDISPPLSIANVPKGAKTLSIIMDDPDAPMGTFTHWIIWNIPSSKTQFAKGEKFSFPQGLTSFGMTAYGGPCPPSGTHRYFFKIYALDTELDLSEGSSVMDLQKAMLGHVITESTLMGKYSRN